VIILELPDRRHDLEPVTCRKRHDLEPPDAFTVGVLERGGRHKNDVPTLTGGSMNKRSKLVSLFGGEREIDQLGVRLERLLRSVRLDDIIY
jgi:hypothetical protein